MRVLVYGLSTDKLGGIETFLLNMNKFMSDDMIFDYVIEGNETIHQKAIDEKGGRVYSVAPKRRIINNIYDWIKLLLEYKKMSCVIYFNMFSLAWSIPVFLAKIFDYKVIIHAHNNNLHECGMLLKSLHNISRFLICHISVERFTNSQLSADFFFKNMAAEMIYNAIDTDRFSFSEEVREIYREKLDVCGKHLYGFSGRICYQKNPMFLIEVFSEIKRLDPTAAFVICGEGDMREATYIKSLELGVEISFLGNVKNMQDYYQAMDCYILPSRYEGLGIVLIEAQCTGLQCVTSADVVPRDAQITELLEFVPIYETAQYWADICVRKVNNIVERSKYKCKVEKSLFNIKIEAPNLEKRIRKLESE